MELPPNYQIPQTIHSAIQFANDFPVEQKEWFAKSNSIITVAVKDERALWEFGKVLKKKNIKHSKFFEPDIGEGLTAIALVPGPDNKRVCSSLPLAGKHNGAEGQARLDKIFDIVDAMKECRQSKDQNILEHGIAVRERLFDLIGYLRDERPLGKEWKLPAWFEENKYKLMRGLADDYTLNKYTIWHDMGKPYCRSVDEYGKQHFPDHAEKSAEMWSSISNDEKIKELILADMDIHKLSAVGVDEFIEKNKYNCVSLLLAGLAEIHANAEMFGGTESTSFKIKMKHINSRGRLICDKLFADAKKYNK